MVALLKIILLIYFVRIYAAKEQYSEILSVKYLNNDHLLAHFSFSIDSPFSPVERKLHYKLLPKIIGDIFYLNNLNELSLSLTQGFWHNQLWYNYDSNSRPSGAQVLASFLPDTLK